MKVVQNIFPAFIVIVILIVIPIVITIIRPLFHFPTIPLSVAKFAILLSVNPS